MNIHEYQGKEILRRFGVATPRGIPCFSVAEADEAARAPERIHKVAVDPVAGLTDCAADSIARVIGVPDECVVQARGFMQGLYRAFVDCDAALAEINPVVITGAGQVLALDAKLNFDSNALFRHPQLVSSPVSPRHPASGWAMPAQSFPAGRGRRRRSWRSWKSAASR
jgi:succinyl-CoA synthetase beta subunit